MRADRTLQARRSTISLMCFDQGVQGRLHIFFQQPFTLAALVAKLGEGSGAG